jgi:enoyl-CoA hydratase
VALEIAARLAALPPQSVRDTKGLLNSALHRAIDTMLARAVETETASFDEPAFRANLTEMLRRRVRS